ncbi:conserved hypothetical integral membrane [Comamonas thiooxydans]|nr:conserved hypothetical integral membrane [Comamonas thiooxydans]
MERDENGEVKRHARRLRLHGMSGCHDSPFWSMGAREPMVAKSAPARRNREFYAVRNYLCLPRPAYPPGHMADIRKSIACSACQSMFSVVNQPAFNE